MKVIYLSGLLRAVRFFLVLPLLFFATILVALISSTNVYAKEIVSTQFEWHQPLGYGVPSESANALCNSFDLGIVAGLHYLGDTGGGTAELTSDSNAICTDIYGVSTPIYFGCMITYDDESQVYLDHKTPKCQRPTPPGCSVGNPTDVITHAKIETADDWVSQKDPRFRLRRFYRSDTQLVGAHANKNYDGHAGVWRQEYSDAVRDNFETGLIRSYNPSSGGRHDFIGPVGPNAAVRKWHSYEIDFADGSYIIRDGKGKTRYLSSNVAWNGILDEIHWNDGYKIQLERAPHIIGDDSRRFQLLSISDNRGQRAELTWSNSAVTNSTTWVVSKIEIDTDYDGVVFAPQVSVDYGYAENTFTPDRPKISSVTRTDIGNSTTEIIAEYSYVSGGGLTDAFYPPALSTIRDGRVDGSGNAFDYATFTYQPNGISLSGKVTSSGHFGGAETHTFDTASSTVSNSLGRDTVYTSALVEGLERVSSVQGVATSSCLGTALNYDYTPGASEPEGFVYERTERNGSKTTFIRDSKGRVLTKTEDALGLSPRVTTYAWHADYKLPLTRTTSQMSESFSYSAEGLLTQYSQTDVLVGSPNNGNVRTWDYWYTTLASGMKVLTLLDGPGLAANGVVDEIAYTYDVDGNLLTTTDPNGLVTTIATMNAMGQPTRIDNPDGTKWVFDYDALGRVTSSGFGPSWAVLPTNTYTYDVVGQLLSVTNTLGNTWTFTYDEARRLTETTSPTGEVATYAHDAMGNITRTEFSDGTTAATFWEDTQFDELGRLLKTIGANGQTWNFSHDVEDNLSTITDPTSLQTTQSFDALNRLTDVVDRAGFTTSMEHNDADQTTKYTDPRLIDTDTIYNGFGEVVSEVSADRGTMSYSYNNRGLATSMTDARGITVNYLYDDAGHLTKIDYPSGSTPDVTFTYSATQGHASAGKVALVWDGAIRTDLTYAVYGDGPHPAHKYRFPSNKRYSIYEAMDFEGNYEWLQYPVSNNRIYSDYDTDDRITRLRVKLFATNTYVTIIDNITYLPNGPVASMTYGDGFTQTLTYDSSYRLTGITDSNGTTTLRDVDMGYSTRDNLASVTNQLDALRNESFTYSTRELVASANGAYGDLGFTYDAVGNRSSRSSTVAAVTTTDTYNYLAIDNRLASITGGTTRTFTHDAAGNVTYDNRSGQGYGYTYDAANRMESFSINGVVQAEYKYNYLGQQAIRTLTQTGQVINSIYGPDGNRMAEFDFDPVSKASTLLREYVWFEGKPIAVIEGGVVYYVRSDHIGKPVFATDATGTKVWEATYLPFGGVHTSTGANINLRFPGQWFQSESGLHQNWMRDYDPTTGRYFQADPLGLVDGASVYGYVGQNPGRYVDPRGESSVGDAISGFGTFWRGLSRCVRGYCFNQNEEALRKFSEALDKDPLLKECLQKLLYNYANNHKALIAGRLFGGQSLGAFTLLGTRGRPLAVRGAASSSTGAALSTFSAAGDLGYYLTTNSGQTNMAAAAMTLMYGHGNYDTSDLPCGCEEVLDNYRNGRWLNE